MEEANRCEFDIPDCFNCPYEDCIAMLEDVLRQESCEKKMMRENRDRKIVDMKRRGYKVREIADVFKMSIGTVSTILHKEKMKAV